MSPQSAVCKHCTGPLPAPSRAGAGRPVEYCSTRCRRAREYAIARAQRAAERAERELTDARRDEAVGRGWMTSPKHVAFWAAEVERTRAELEALL